MSNRMHLSDTMQTTCPHCNSIFKLTTDHLESARGQVRCSECMQVFNALLSLENFTGEFDDSLIQLQHVEKQNQQPEVSKDESVEESTDEPVSLKQAMYGDNYSSANNFRPLLWVAGILLLVITVIVQTVYYQRYTLISSPHYQQQILNLCQILPCDESRFSNLAQIKLLERNIFTHPTRKNALMVSGSFVNKASFSQAIPSLLISLSDTQGNFIANRLFKSEEFLADKTLNRLKPGKPVQFRLEILDPGSEALAYEFEFYS
ncbi:MAG: DUF3426 domain-containing protein [Gammaproteobacteria bacterium]|jgi:predicted Zn finger-like uncharacterized protein|nr:DUF3426 domain-containing protein [Gammaproteobacteria bacterium]MBT3722425.1 DUF3426 domain-containing protein [Gammaproteobacteria bacterium]MBT4076135.1 DUF3426 domain-containing protein [Gammaproteobacteria bacterium]MBT4196562.1 DUF3426 domain-containing protein [Gammaproteobacteria bacterium]MBT4449937.1 DUF3426 domain-containing protein [Gammaproteobacteria bacterium]